MRRPFLDDVDGQASVEAALLLPTVLLTLGMLLQPACLLYTRMVMAQAAAETARLLVTSDAGDEAVRAFCLRRLGAVPDTGLFHAGGEQDWRIDLSNEGGSVEVSITGHVRPLPVFAFAAGLVLDHDDAGIVVHVAHAQRLRPTWLGGDEDGWASVWN